MTSCNSLCYQAWVSEALFLKTWAKRIIGSLPTRLLRIRIGIQQRTDAFKNWAILVQFFQYVFSGCIFCFCFKNCVHFRCNIRQHRAKIRHNNYTASGRARQYLPLHAQLSWFAFRMFPFSVRNDPWGNVSALVRYHVKEGLVHAITRKVVSAV